MATYGGARDNAGRPPSGDIDERGYTKRKKIAFYVTDEEKEFLRWVMKLVRTMDNTKDMYNVELTGRLIDALSIIKDEYINDSDVNNTNN